MSTAIWITLIVLLLPGLLMIGAVVMRLLFRGFRDGDDAPAAKALDAQGDPVGDEAVAMAVDAGSTGETPSSRSA